MNVIATGRYNSVNCVACGQHVPSGSVHACDTEGYSVKK